MSGRMEVGWVVGVLVAEEKGCRHLWQWEGAREEGEGYKVQPAEATKQRVCQMSLITDQEGGCDHAAVSVMQKPKLSSI